MYITEARGGLDVRRKLSQRNVRCNRNVLAVQSLSLSFHQVLTEYPDTKRQCFGLKTMASMCDTQTVNIQLDL